MGQFPTSRKRILITHLMTKTWIQAFSQTDSLERYLTKVGCSMSVIGEDNNLIFTQKFSSGDHLFVYTASEKMLSV